MTWKYSSKVHYLKIVLKYNTSKCTRLHPTTGNTLVCISTSYNPTTKNLNYPFNAITIRVTTTLHWPDHSTFNVLFPSQFNWLLKRVVPCVTRVLISPQPPDLLTWEVIFYPDPPDQDKTTTGLTSSHLHYLSDLNFLFFCGCLFKFNPKPYWHSKGRIPRSISAVTQMCICKLTVQWDDAPEWVFCDIDNSIYAEQIVMTWFVSSSHKGYLYCVSGL